MKGWQAKRPDEAGCPGAVPTWTSPMRLITQGSEESRLWGDSEVGIRLSAQGSKEPGRQH